MTEFKPIKEGKVREIYDNGDSLIIVCVHCVRDGVQCRGAFRVARSG